MSMVGYILGLGDRYKLSKTFFQHFISIYQSSFIIYYIMNNLFFLPSNHRHPSNLMLDRLSGKILHIDFGDCFEVDFLRNYNK